MNSLINQATLILKRGGLIAMPTETVYGLGADAKNPDALRKIFQAKQRPTDHPLIVHLADISQLSEWVRAISPSAQRLAEAFWPGPLTLILPKAAQVSDLVTGCQQTVGVRIPRHPIAQALLRSFGSGIAAPSANRFGRISPTTAAAVYEELGDTVDLILDGGICVVGVESTIVDVSGKYPVILRPGMITSTQIEAVIHQTLVTQKRNVPRVSGSLEAHYAPATYTQLLSTEEFSHFLETLTEGDLPVALMIRTPLTLKNKKITCIAMSADPELYAHDLYQTLRALDNREFKRIVIEDVPQSERWQAIRDRLLKASFRPL
ncbi:MAG: ywlC [Gammaproteobacteria bacterium]|jgi:L-threonylcarbamoyladenylate synthase|nr:ywlC [Gammaproteobacteria bacterium]